MPQAENIDSKVIQEVSGKISKGKKVNVQKEPVYTVEELAENAKAVFDTRKECVETALKLANRTEYTVSKAKEIVKGFLNREVK